MANRYANINELKTQFSKKRYLGSIIYPKIKPSDNDIYLISEASDRLDLLAHKYYGDTGLWWIIAVANNLNNASLSIEPGKQLRIPSDIGKILNDLNKINK
jgi:nucleoid-associated protein YgaU